jgi:hypothetical protein
MYKYANEQGGKVATLKICDMCRKFNAIWFVTYEHPNAEKYSVNVCVFCKKKNAQWEVQ